MAGAAGMNLSVRIRILDREVEDRPFLALAAAEQGHDVPLGAMSAVLSCRFWLVPGSCHDEGVTPNHTMSDLHRRVLQAGFAVTDQDEKPGLSKPDAAPFLRRRSSRHTIAYESAPGPARLSARDRAAHRRATPVRDGGLHRAGRRAPRDARRRARQSPLRLTSRVVTSRSRSSSSLTLRSRPNRACA